MSAIELLEEECGITHTYHLVSTQSGDPLYLTTCDTTADMARMEGYSVDLDLDLSDPGNIDISNLDLPVR